MNKVALLVLLVCGFAPGAVVRSAPASGRSALSVIRVVRDVPYVLPRDPSRTGDLYLPATQGGAYRPAVVIVHGGSWIIGTKEDPGEVFVARGLAERGYVAFSIDYRLLGAGGEFPHDVQDVRDGLAFLASRAARWRIDVHRLAVVGTSAGGHLGLLVAYTPNRGAFASPHYLRSGVRVRAAVAYYPPTDFVTFRRAGFWQDLIARAYLGGSYQQKPGRYRQASPVSYVRGAVPTLLVHGTADDTVPLSQSIELNRLLRRQGIPSTLIQIRGASHDFNNWDAPARDEAFGHLVTFLGQTLGPPV